MKLILLGAPGAGKGSQAVKLAERYGIARISTGDALRADIARKTESGLYAKSFVDKGLLVPDEVVLRIVADRIKQDDCKNGYILDGFPRTLKQAIELDKSDRIDRVIDIEVRPELIVDRITGRRMCACGASYHTSFYHSDTCSLCGGKLYRRADDNEDTVRERIAVYEKQTAPLVEYYRKKGILSVVDGNTDIETVFGLVTKVLDGNN